MAHDAQELSEARMVMREAETEIMYKCEGDTIGIMDAIEDSARDNVEYDRNSDRGSMLERPSDLGDLKESKDSGMDNAMKDIAGVDLGGYQRGCSQPVSGE